MTFSRRIQVSTFVIIKLKSKRKVVMLAAKRKSEVVTFPISVFETADTKDDLEDWLLSQTIIL